MTDQQQQVLRILGEYHPRDAAAIDVAYRMPAAVSVQSVTNTLRSLVRQGHVLTSVEWVKSKQTNRLRDARERRYRLNPKL